MFLRSKRRFKNGKWHRYYSIFENRRLAGDRVVQRQVLYLGEINDSQEAAWRKTLEVFDEQRKTTCQMSLFPEDREIPPDAVNGLGLRMTELALRRCRAFGDCWLALTLWRELHLDQFWAEHFASEEGDVAWEQVLAIRPIHHHLEERVEAHILVAFLGYALLASQRMKLQYAAAGLTPRIEPEAQQQLVLDKLHLALPPQPPPRIRSGAVILPAAGQPCSADL